MPGYNAKAEHGSNSSLRYGGFTNVPVQRHAFDWLLRHSGLATQTAIQPKNTNLIKSRAALAPVRGVP